jgi:FKBP-type peptidyl-prolyl cis-trans isomerase
MKLLSSFRYRRLVLAGMLVAVLSFGTMTQVLVSSASAQTPPPAPSGSAAVDKDAASGKPVVTTPSGLKYVDLVVGTGPAVKSGDHVSVNYVGKLLDGTKFDASADHGGTFDYQQGVTSLIAGWTEGTSTMKVGGKRKLIIPPQLGYGMEGAGGGVIPPNATLIFEIELVKDTDAAPAK